MTSTLGLPAIPDGLATYATKEIHLEGVDESDVGPVHSTISIEKSWLDENNIHPWSVELRRLDEESNSWVTFSSKRSSTVGGDSSYTAVLPGFSKVSITGGPFCLR